VVAERGGTLQWLLVCHSSRKNNNAGSNAHIQLQQEPWLYLTGSSCQHMHHADVPQLCNNKGNCTRTVV
jgi:hypothetical protein